MRGNPAISKSDSASGLKLADLGITHKQSSRWQRAVETLLRDEEWSRWSDRRIAREAHVTHPFVIKLRESLVTVTSEPVPTERLYTDKHGNTSADSTSRLAPRVGATGVIPRGCGKSTDANVSDSRVRVGHAVSRKATRRRK